MIFLEKFPTLSRAKSNGSTNFVLSIKFAEPSIFRRPPKNLVQLFFTVDRKSSQTKTFSRKVFFMFCLEHFL